ncbi:MAG TPA: MBL fold metallo-hydrolase [Vicinamibacterales bacterium]|nr:MBL fold metallo-hydrolase [Vicinamibacterales bacterium]
MPPTLRFLGAAQTVTGSKYLFESGGAKILVDAGLFQGLKELRERNWQPLPVAATEIDAIVLTHAHLDHCGYLPRLVSEGFRGRIFCTPGTKDLCRIVLPDSGRIQEEDAEQANREGYTRHAPALPLYTENDAINTLAFLQPVGYERPVPIAEGIEVEFINAGHLLGSAYARIRTASHDVLFGGDLGRFDRPVLPDPTMVQETGYLLIESTYGDRLHEDDDDGEKLARVIRDTIERGGRVVIPAFAVGRVEELLYWIRKLEIEKRIPVVPVYLDSPMAAEALARYRERIDELDAEVQPGGSVEPAAGTAESRLFDRRRAVAAIERDLCAFCTAKFKVVATSRESHDLARSNRPAIVISSSGMATGGRVLHHLRAALPDSRNTALLVGFQAEGTRGRRLLNGEKTLRIHGADVPVHAQVERIDSMSAHADAREIMRWLGGFARPPRTTFLVHGELPAMTALRDRIVSELGWNVHIPRWQESADLGE